MVEPELVVQDNCVLFYEQLQKHDTLKAIIFTIRNESAVVIERGLSIDSDYETFLRRLPKDKSRYALYDHSYTDAQGDTENRLVFITWLPEQATEADKALYMDFKDTFVRCFPEVALEVNAVDEQDLAYDELTKVLVG